MKPWEKISTNVLAVVVSLALTLVAFFAWTSYAGIAVVWYYIVAAVIVGIMMCGTGKAYRTHRYR